MKRVNIIFLLGIVSIFLGSISEKYSYAQTHELGITAGLAHYKGELSPVILNYRSVRPTFSGFYRFNFSNALSLRANLAYGRIGAKDSSASDPFARARNHRFVTILLEVSGQLEYNFFNFRGGSKKNPITFSPYLFGGVGITNFQSVTNIQPKYPTITASIPLGIGFKTVLKDNWNLGLEFGSRFTFTDYLDDVGVDVSGQVYTPRPAAYYTGNPKDRDMYFFTVVTLSYAFPDIGRACPIKLKRKDYNQMRE
ncbi:MAG: DUF6089 family protein [Microscillaceae bacterium]|nr:DUF6089 family protein [Microscillaceae bacterium]MDW8460361.1 DUF6089 family protein [Cytophagales bacterium]